MNILIVEDNINDFEYCKKQIKNIIADCLIFHAETAEDALFILNDNIIDAAFLDRELPGIDGFTLAEKIRNIDLYHMLPIIFVTAVDANTMEVYQQFKNYEYVRKPYTSTEFKEKAEQFLISVKKHVSTLSMKEKPEATLKVSINRIPESIDTENILFVESYKKRLTIYTAKQIYENIYMSLDDFISSSNNPFIMRCHKSCAVNVKKIESVKESSLKTWDIYFGHEFDGKCPLSLKYRKNVLNMFYSK